MSHPHQMFTATTLAALAAAALFIASATPASADYTVVQQGKDMASVSADHKRGSVCDREKDGNAVYMVVWTGARYLKEWDGGDRGCDNLKHLEPGRSIMQVKVCENTRRGDNDACSHWALTHNWGSRVSEAR
jgi:hypothetical protein